MREIVSEDKRKKANKRLHLGAGRAETEGSNDDRAHSPDFRSVYWHGETYCFTTNQALVVKLLYDNFIKKTPDVGDERLLMSVDRVAPPARLSTLFRNNAAWGKLIVQGATKGTHRLKTDS